MTVLGDSSLDSLAQAKHNDDKKAQILRNVAKTSEADIEREIKMRVAGDIDFLCHEVSIGGELADANGDGSVTLADVDHALEEVLPNHFGYVNPIPYGDADLNGSVTFADFMILVGNFNQSDFVSWTRGDFNCDGTVGLRDFVLLRREFLKPVPAATAQPGTSQQTITTAASSDTAAFDRGLATDAVLIQGGFDFDSESDFRDSLLPQERQADTRVWMRLRSPTSAP